NSNVSLHFWNENGLTFSNLACDTQSNPNIIQTDDRDCLYQNLGSFETKIVSVNLNIPNPAKQSTFFDYSINYEYPSNWRATLPIIRPSSSLIPTGFQQSSPAVSPANLTIVPTFFNPNYVAYDNRSFQLKFVFYLATSLSFNCDPNPSNCEVAFIPSGKLTID